MIGDTTGSFLPRCPVCKDHPGWEHPEETGKRSDPADVCKACYGSGVYQGKPKQSPGHRRSYPDIDLQWAELREELVGFEYVLNVNDVNDLVEVWVDPRTLNTTAVANLRLLPEDAIRLAEQLICAAERIEADHA